MNGITLNVITGQSYVDREEFYAWQPRLMSKLSVKTDEETFWQHNSSVTCTQNRLPCRSFYPGYSLAYRRSRLTSSYRLGQASAERKQKLYIPKAVVIHCTVGSKILYKIYWAWRNTVSQLSFICRSIINLTVWDT